MSQRTQTLVLTIAGVILVAFAIATDWPGSVVVVVFVVLALGAYQAGRHRGDEQ